MFRPPTRSCLTFALALLLLVLGVGVPIPGHSHHEGGERHVGPPSHAHGMALVRHEVQFERTVAPMFIAPPIGAVLEPPIATIQRDCPPASETEASESRAPPSGRPRAPPV